MSLEARLDRLERANRRLLVLWALSLFAALGFGFQKADDVVRARRFEVVDSRGVPLATLAPSRADAGGELILRDREGERRANLTVEKGAASLGLQGGKVEDPTGTAAIRADADGAAMGLVGARAGVVASVRKERPRIATTDAQGKETFRAPWK